MSDPKIPPHNLDAEASVLGSLLIDKDAVVKVASLLQPEHFYRDVHSLIYKAIMALYENHEPADLVTVTNELKKQKILEKVGGASQITELVNATPTSTHVEHHAKIVRDLATKRHLISVSSQIAEMGYEHGLSLEDLLDKAESSLFSISTSFSRSEFIHVKPLVEEAVSRLDTLHKNPQGWPGVSTGLKSLDSLLAGLQPSNLVILAARPSVGKTSLALNICAHAAIRHKVPVGVFSLETSREQLIYRLLASEADIDSWRLSTGKGLEEEDFEKLGAVLDSLTTAPFFIDDTPGISVAEIRTKTRRLQLEHAVGLIVVDYLQLAHGRNLENRVQEVSEISQALKNLARELRIPVLAVSQLSRAVEARGTPRPQLSDLRESGSIEQDADVVMFLYREDDDDRQNVKLLVSKHRNGPTGEIPLFFRGERTRFFEVEEQGEG